MSQRACSLRSWSPLAFALALVFGCSQQAGGSLDDQTDTSGGGAATGTPSASGKPGAQSGGNTTPGSGTPGASGTPGTSGTPSSSGADGGTPGQTGPLPSGDLDAAKAFVAPLILGVNVERGWAWDLPGQSSSSSTQFWSYLKNTVGVTHVRLFYPWRPSLTMGGGGANNAPPDQGQFNRILDAASQAIAAGLKVFVDCTDVMGIEDFTGDNGMATETHIANCADWTAQRHLDPAMFAIGPVNEWAGGDDNTTYNSYRQHYHDVLRAKLPGYVLTTGPGYWKSRDWLYDPSKKFETFSDLRVVYEWHHYSSLDAAGWQAEEAKLQAWRNANGGRPTICGEAGPGYWGEDVGGSPLDQAPSAWPSHWDQQLPNIAQEHPSLWAITYGGSYRLNRADDDPTVMDGSGGSPNLLQSLVSNRAAMKSALGL